MTIQSTFEQHVREMWRDKGSPIENLFVMTVGLAGETGEVCELLKKHVRDNKLDFQALKHELGDVLYYLTRIADTFGMSLDEIMVANMDKLNARRAEGAKYLQPKEDLSHPQAYLRPRTVPEVA